MNKILASALLAFSLTVSANSQDKPLFEAIRNKQTEQIARMLNDGNIELNPPQQAYQVNKPLAYAAAYGNLEIVKLLLAKGADINGRVAYGDVPLIKAAEHDNKAILRYLIEHGADVNQPNAFGISPFIGFCAGPDIILVKLAMEHGGKINESYPLEVEPNRGKKNYNALQSAVVYGSPETVKLLLDHGGDPLLKDSSGKTCFDLALEKNRPAITEILKALKHQE